jgi:hypothetical protein
MRLQSAREHLEWSAKCALVYYDQGDTKIAVACFIQNVRRHGGTAHIVTPPLLQDLLAEGEKGRDEFKQFMLSFTVYD